MDRASRPLIGVTASVKGGRWMGYANRFALWRAGARSVRIDAANPFPIDQLDGLVIGGGDDIDATLYGGEVAPTVRIDEERDKLELRVLAHAAKRDLPVLGICRGSQMINVHRGGSLYTDIYEVFVKAPRLRTVLPRKSVEITEGSRLAQLLGQPQVRVNALHHQSVDRLGHGVRVAALDRWGIVQAIEVPQCRFLIGVQWHPEFLIFDRREQNLFRALVDAARHAQAGEPQCETSGGTMQIEVTQRYASDATRVYDSWLDRTQLGAWMFGATMQDEILRIDIDPRVGGKFSFLVRRGGQEIDHVGEYLALDRPGHIAFTWGIAGMGDPSRVTIAITPDGSGAQAKLTAEIPPKWADYADRTRAGWAKILAAQADALQR
jgi:putative glutamine amidotransferase